MSLLPEVRDELVGTAARRAATARTRRPSRLRFGRGGIAVALSAGVAVAVVAVAVLALRHRAPASSGRPADASIAALEAKLAVLRRPQTAADRSYPRSLVPHGQRNPLGLIPQLTRLAATVSTPTVGRVRVYLLVRRQLGRVPPQAAPALRSDLLTALAVDGRGTVVGATSAPFRVALTPSMVGRSLSLIRPARPRFEMLVAIVPDGVERVKWTFTGAAIGVLHPRPVTVYPRVENNVAVAAVGRHQGPLASAVWYGASGKIVASAATGRAYRQELDVIDTVNASRNRPISPVLVAHYSLFRTVPPDDLANDPSLPAPDTGQGLNYWQTRHIGSLTGLDGSGIWVTPGLHWLCVSDPQAGECGPLTHVATGFLGGTTSNGRETTWAGLVPDGNSTITLVLAGGARKRFPVIDNVYEVTVRGRVVAIINRDIHGRIVRTPFG